MLQAKESIGGGGKEIEGGSEVDSGVVLCSAVTMQKVNSPPQYSVRALWLVSDSSEISCRSQSAYGIAKWTMLQVITLSVSAVRDKRCVCAALLIH